MEDNANESNDYSALKVTKTVDGASVDRAGLSGRALERAVLRPGGVWREIRVVRQTGSTNADLLSAARDGASEGLVLVAEFQTAGRGRLDRGWASPPGAGLTFSVLLRPRGVPSALLGWIPLLAGVAAGSAVRSSTGVDIRLKWPNDLLADERKLGGILAESWADAVVVGIGLNVSNGPDELPGPAATSLALEAAGPRTARSKQAGAAAPAGAGARPSADRAAAAAGPAEVGTPEAAPAIRRADVLAAVLGELAAWYQAWVGQAAPGDPDSCGLRQAYRERSATLGRAVAALLPGGGQVTGTAVDVDRSGQLVIDTAAGPVPVSAGDVVHLR